MSTNVCVEVKNESFFFKILYLFWFKFVDYCWWLKKFGSWNRFEFCEMRIIGLCLIDSSIDFINIDDLNESERTMNWCVWNFWWKFVSSFSRTTDEIKISNIVNRLESPTPTEDFRRSDVNDSVKVDGKRLLARVLKLCHCFRGWVGIWSKKCFLESFQRVARESNVGRRERVGGSLLLHGWSERAFDKVRINIRDTSRINKSIQQNETCSPQSLLGDSACVSHEFYQ